MRPARAPSRTRPILPLFVRDGVISVSAPFDDLISRAAGSRRARRLPALGVSTLVSVPMDAAASFDVQRTRDGPPE